MLNQRLNPSLNLTAITEPAHKKGHATLTFPLPPPILCRGEMKGWDAIYEVQRPSIGQSLQLQTKQIPAHHDEMIRSEALGGRQGRDLKGTT